MAIIEINNNKQNLFAVFGLLFGAVCWGIIWYPYRLLANAGISGITSSFYSYSLALLIGCLLFAKYWRSLLAIPKRAYWLCLFAGWTNLSYVLAVIDGEVMRVMLLFYLSPIWTLVLARFWLKESIHITGLIAIMISLIGAVIMLNDFSTISFPAPRNQAEWLALSAGIGFSLTNVFTRQATYLSVAAKSMLVWLGVVSLSILLLFFLDGNLMRLINISEYIAWEYLSLFVLIALMLVLATLCVQYGVTKITAIRASVLFMFELVVAAVAAYFLANETMQINEWLGGTLIVISGLFAALNTRSTN